MKTASFGLQKKTWADLCTISWELVWISVSFLVFSRDIQCFNIWKPVVALNMYCTWSSFSISGYLTTRGTLLSLICVLAKRPDLQKSLQREVDGVIGQDREPRLSDREKCPLLEAVVLETLRYISHVPLFIPHATSASTTIGGYKIAKGTMVT